MLHLQLDIDQPRLPDGHATTRHLIARIVPPAADTTRELPPLDLAIVIDASGSMTGAPLEAAKEASLRLARELPSSTRLTIVSFADDVVVHAEGLLLDAAGRTEIGDHLAGLQPRGCTNLHGGWRTGCTLLAAADLCDRPRRRHVVVLSDGHANSGQCQPDALASESRAQLERGISTSCVGIGDGYSPAQLTALAEHGGGACHDAENAREIVEVLLGEVLSLAEVTAEHLELVLDVPEGVNARELSGLPGTFDGRRLVVSAGTVRAGIERAIVVRLAIPAGGADLFGHEALAFRGHLTWRDPGAGERRAGAHVVVQAVPSAEPIAPPAVADAHTVLVAWQAHLVRLVTALNRDGDFAGLERLWQDEFGPFASYAAQHAATEGFVHTIETIRRRARRPMPERARKVAYDLATKGARQAEVFYQADKGGIAGQFLDS